MRVSATHLESYRLYRDGDWMSFEQLAGDIRRDRPPTEPMLRGKSLHAVAEDPERYYIRGNQYDCHGFLWDQATLDPVFADLTGGVAEPKTTRCIETDHGLATLVGKCDYIKGNVVIELKTKDKAFKPEDYASSMQWKSYVYLFGVASVVYRLAQIQCKDEVWFVRNFDDLPLYAYEALPGEVESITREFVSLCAEHGLLSYLEPRRRAA